MTITQSFLFEVAHRLPNVPCSHERFRMHGHSCRVDREREGSVDPQTGSVTDFFEIKHAFAKYGRR